MKFIAGFHIHSKYSRATSKEMDVENIAKWAKIKGINVIGTGDFTHPQWLKELKEKIEPAESGLFRIKNPEGHLRETGKGSDVRFILTTEISGIYKKGDRVRKIHNLIFAPSFEVVDKINTQLSRIGNLKSDGRPILGLDAKELLKIVLDISEDCLVVAAHAWTPWFSLFGANSGFDSIEECFEEYSKHIYAIETGLSSDPKMNWRLSALDKITLISNSDAHSPAKLGREANVFDCNMNYEAIIKAIKNNKLVMTIEFFPQEGKYHFDGHRLCGVCLTPEEAKRYNNICPKCGKPLTIGVMHRVDELADRKTHQGKVPYKNLIPLPEIIADALGVGPNTKRVNAEYEKMISAFGNEFKILLEVDIKDLRLVTLPIVAEGIKRVRQGKVYIQPGFDGQYGKISIFSDKERENFTKQTTLF
jgi:uncharacterized protein (TIGR00375 family)